MSNLKPAKAKLKSITVLGTGSGVGKTILVTALCRILHQDGFLVSPFKAINISLNSGVTSDGKEMAISQIVQAEASGIEPTISMNPVLVKPQSKRKPQFILNGKVTKNKTNMGFWPVIKRNFDSLRMSHNPIVIEGSGSPTELDYISCDIANLQIARYAKSPILLVGDIDKGGVFASLVGTVSLLKRYDPESASQIKGFIINKYKGERKYLDPGLVQLTEITGIPVLGVIPSIENHQIPDEDTWNNYAKTIKKKSPLLDIVIINTPTLQNSQDFDPLIQHPQVQVRYVSDPQDFGNPNLVILAGSKSTVADLQWIRQKKLSNLILKHAKAQKPIIGICGGFQMLGKTIKDPSQVESSKKLTQGLGLLNLTTTFHKRKTTKRVSGVILQNKGLLKAAKGLKITGYEIHMGKTNTEDNVVLSDNGWVLGTYFHSIFHNEKLLDLILKNIASQAGIKLSKTKKAKSIDKYDRLAKVVRDNIDMTLFYQILEKGI